MIIVNLILVLYTIALLLIFCYALIQLNLLFNYLKSKKKQTNLPTLDFTDLDKVPYVTIQLPVYNELYVMERLLDNISKLDYPSERIEIQVLDDSTDESLNTTATKIKELQTEGLDIKHVLRDNREAFKAGALKEGLKSAQGEFIAIFDADFMPKPDWLKKTVPHFHNPEIGVVQTKWGHIN
ncbi:MAG: glycosyltransferase, partial [Flavobacteriaceae bacterium]|nr:glycosyltransferase [Flavobacteriaceae bacterium]